MTAPEIPEQVDLRKGEVSLRLLVMRDAAGLAAAAAERRGQDGAVPVPFGLEAAYRTTTIAYHQLRTATRYTFAIRWQERIVGSTSYTGMVARPIAASALERSGPLAVEIGHTWLAHSAHRPDVGIAVAFLLLQYAFETWQVQRVRMRCAVRDGHAAQAIAVLGLRRDGILRGDVADADGTLCDSLVYSLLAEEWPEVRCDLQSRRELHQAIG
jgi:RimJ/RimL family protein N-acetyltransferase